MEAGHPIGEIYLSREEIARRVAELGVELAEAYAGLEPLLVAPLKASTVFLADLSRAIPVPHAIDFVELATYADGLPGGVRLLKDLDTSIVDRHVLIVEDAVDTGLTLNYLARTLALRRPASISAVRCSTGRTAGSPTTFRSTTSASPSPTSCLRATGSGSTSAGARCPTCTSSRPTSGPPRSRAPPPPEAK